VGCKGTLQGLVLRCLQGPWKPQKPSKTPDSIWSPVYGRIIIYYYCYHHHHFIHPTYLGSLSLAQIMDIFTDVTLHMQQSEDNAAAAGYCHSTLWTTLLQQQTHLQQFVDQVGSCRGHVRRYMAASCHCPPEGVPRITRGAHERRLPH
jgi:hypothetical protein